MSVVTNHQHTKIANLIRAGKAFRNGGESFSGESLPRGTHWVYEGRMSEESSRTMSGHTHSPGIDYVIRSYSTPIAYRLTDGTDTWIVPTDHYSPTTQRHQSAVWSILRELNVDTHFEWVPDVSEKTGKPLKTRSHREKTAFSGPACVSELSTHHSDDHIHVFNGSTEPRHLCGFHAMREGFTA